MNDTLDPGALPTPPDVIAFDVVGTLVSLAALEPLMTAAGGDASTVRVWFTRLLADGFAVTAAAGYQSFHDVAEAALHQVLPKSKAVDRRHVLNGLAALDAFPDAGPAMGRAVQDARVIVITNASVASTNKLLERAHLDTFVETVVSAEQSQVWKPAADTYSLAAGAVGVPVERMGIVTAHPWDVLGAQKAGFVTGWCNRDEAWFPPTFGGADVAGANLVEVVEGLFAWKGAA